MNSITRKMVLIVILLMACTAAGDEAEIDPDAVNVTINAPEYVSEDTFEVTINVTEVTDFDSGQFDLMFDPDVINVVDVTDGNIDDTKISIDMWRHMDDDRDRVRVVFNANAGAEGVSGYGYVAKITFEVVGAIGDTSAIDMSDEFERGLNYLEPREGYDTVGPADLPANWFGTNVTIGTAPPESDETPTPTPTETPAVNATPELESAPTPTATPVTESLELSSNPFGLTASAESAPAAAVPGASPKSSEDGGLAIPTSCDIIPIYSLVGLFALIYAIIQFK